MRLPPRRSGSRCTSLPPMPVNTARSRRIRLDIGWATDGDIFAMSWAEHDGPPVSVPQRRGFGTIVMEHMTERSVDGRVDLEYPPSGVTWRFTFPAANALEPWEREQN